MTKEEFEAIVAQVRTWPREKLEEVAVTLLARDEEEEDDGSDLTEEDWADLNEGLAEADRGEFVPEKEMKAFFAKFRR